MCVRKQPCKLSPALVHIIEGAEASRKKEILARETYCKAGRPPILHFHITEALLPSN
jgi:hypothetical protein